LRRAVSAGGARPPRVQNAWAPGHPDRGRDARASNQARGAGGAGCWQATRQNAAAETRDAAAQARRSRRLSKEVGVLCRAAVSVHIHTPRDSIGARVQISAVRCKGALRRGRQGHGQDDADGPAGAGRAPAAPAAPATPPAHFERRGRARYRLRRPFAPRPGALGTRPGALWTPCPELSGRVPEQAHANEYAHAHAATLTRLFRNVRQP
jgi:hypothetical protein